MAYNDPQAAQQLPFPEESVAAILSALGEDFTISGESGIGDVTFVEGNSFTDPDGMSPVILFDDTGDGASFTAGADETLDRFISGTSGDDAFVTAGGSDEVRLGSGNDVVDTGGGTDVAILNGAYAPDRVQVQEDGSVVVDNGDGTQATLRNTEILQFDDTKVVVTNNAKDGVVALLYEAAFDRQLDNAGYKFWTQGPADDLTVDQIAEYFTESEEFQNLFADVSNAEFVTQIYANFFDREVDEAGYNFWLNLLETEEIDRGTFLSNVAASDEATAKFEAIVKIVGSTPTDTTDDSGAV